MDPHGSVGYIALKEYLTKHPGSKGIFLETAHPVKFYDVVEPVIQALVPIPQAIRNLLNQKKLSIRMGVKYGDFKEYLLHR